MFLRYRFLFEGIALVAAALYLGHVGYGLAYQRAFASHRTQMFPLLLIGHGSFCLDKSRATIADVSSRAYHASSAS